MMTLTRSNYNTLLDGAMDAADMDAYIAEWGTSSIFYPDPDEAGPDMQEVVDVLAQLWAFAHVTIQELITASGGKMTHLSSRFGIPYRTIQGWAAGERQCPVYSLRMMAELLGLHTIKVVD